MNSIRLLDRRAGYVVAAFALLLATFIPALAFAAQVTERSIELSSSTAGATNVSYTTKFKAVNDAGAFVVDFCNDSPVIGAPCTPPTGFDATAAASASGGVTAVNGSTSQIIVTKPINDGESVDVALTGIKNPTTTGTLYARIVTYDTYTNAQAYDSDDLDPGTGKADEGGVALYISPTIGVSGAVRENLTFCVTKTTATASCGNAGAVGQEPTLELGEATGTSKALSSTVVSTGTLSTQISTNAVGGAVISLKSATPCGGMMRAGASGCDIAPALTSDIAFGQAKFGVKTATAAATGGYSQATGTLRPFDEGGAGASYNNTTYTLNYLANNSDGITSPFGDKFLDTNSAPVNNMNMTLTFGASISENTPAGTYSTSLSMIATGKF